MRKNQAERVKAVFDFADKMLCDMADLKVFYETYKKLPMGNSANYHIDWAVYHITKIFEAAGVILDKELNNKKGPNS